jgi:di/tripeptidase
LPIREHPDTARPTIAFVITVGEERGLIGSWHMDVSRLRATRGFVFHTAGVSGAITYSAPTSVYLTITVHGTKVHAGVEPEKGINAMKVAAEAIAPMPLSPCPEDTGGPYRRRGSGDTHDPDRAGHELFDRSMRLSRASAIERDPIQGRWVIVE